MLWSAAASLKQRFYCRMRRVALSLVDAYEQVYSLLDDPTAGYMEQGGTAMVKHTPAQVRTILGVL